MHHKSTILLLSIIILGIFATSNNALSQITVGTTNQTSVGIGNQVPDGASGAPSSALNGRYLIFRSSASNLVAGDTNQASDIFLQDKTTGALSRLSVNSLGLETNDDSTNPTVSPFGPDGFIAAAFESKATNLSSITNSTDRQDIFIRIPSLNLTELISIGLGLTPANDDSFTPSITILPAPNRVVMAFASDASNLVTGDANNKRDIYLAKFTAPKSVNFDLSSLLSISRVSVAAASGFEPNGDSETPAISGDANFIVFKSKATNLISGVTTSGTQIFLKDLSTGAISLISKTSNGLHGNGDSTGPSISYSGRYIAYVTQATNILSDSDAGKKSLVTFDRLTGISTRGNTTSDGIKGNGSVDNCRISANGRFLSFSDSSSNLVLNDTNGVADVFLRDLRAGAVARVSVGVGGANADGASDNAFASGDSFNATTGTISYRSFASNLTQNGLSGGSDVYSTPTELDLETLTKETRFEVPPDIAVVKRSSKITMQKFAGVTITKALSINARAQQPKITFDVRVNGAGARRNVRLQLSSRRNSITVTQLRPGDYTSRYRAITQVGTKVVSKTPFSPREAFSIK